MCTSNIFLGFLAILFPPLPVWIKCGICSADSIINILLSMLGFLPGLLHAWYIIAKFPDDYDYERVPGADAEQGRVTYVFVHGQQPGRQAAPHSGQRPQPNKSTAAPNYGATNTNNGSSSAQAGESSAGGSGEEHRAPPTYAEAVKADNKIQT